MSETAGSRNNGSRDGASVDQLLLEAGMDDDGGLRPMLLDLQALAAERPA
ncbi:MAG TPA: dehydrogenase, partial [Arthrobacter bacterium]|nr:dehydrogenase [Arthrobacter sp.]